MSELTLSLVASELTQPVLDGPPEIGGISWSTTAGTSVDGNSRQMLNGAFDVAEMSFATFLKAVEQGRDVVGLPIFTGRGFLQPAVACAAGSGVKRPEDLAGRRVGLPQLWMTSSVWHRGILAQQHGVRQEQVTWYTQVEERFEGVNSPVGVEVRRLPEGMSLPDALQTGEVDAVMVPPRGARSLGGAPKPYVDLAAAQRDYFRATGVFPIMHFVVMKASVAAAHAGLAERLFEAFVAAKRQAAAGPGLGAPIAGLEAAEQRDLFGADAWPYGLEANRRTLETFLGFTADLGWIAHPKRLEEYFVPATVGLRG